MGKLKKVQPQEKAEGQKKISSFFQKPASTKTSSGLFTQLGQKQTSKKANKVPNANSGKDIIEIKDEDSDFVETKKKDMARKDFAASKLGRALKQSENIRNGCAARNNEQRSECSVQDVKALDPLTIPETQLAVTPDGKGLDPRKENGTELKSEMFQSPAGSEGVETGMIPDTPDNVVEKTKAKRPLGRSFLLATNQFDANPIKQAKENREAKLALKRKKSLLARQSLVSVSVKFNNDPVPPTKKDNDPKGNFEGSYQQTEETKKDITGNIASNVCSSPVKDDSTPTKIYADGVSMKRMANTPISPESKRSAVSEDQPREAEQTTAEVVKSLDFGEETNLEEKVSEGVDKEKYVEEMNKKAAKLVEEEQNKMRERKEKLEMERQARLAKKRQMMLEEKKKNSEKMLKYQLSGNTGSTLAEKTETLTNDDTLDDILQELHSPSILKPSKTTNNKPDRSKDVVMKTLNSLNKNVNPKICDKATKGKRYSLEGVLVDIKDQNETAFVKHKSRVEDKKVLSAYDPHRHLEPTCAQNSKSNRAIDVNTDKLNETDSNTNKGNVSMEWTEEDEQYFGELGLDLEGNQTSPTFNHRKESGKKGQNIILKKKLAKSSECKRNGDHKKLTGSKIENSDSDKLDDLDGTEIGEFPTQVCKRKHETKSAAPLIDVDIEEFKSQSESQQLCKDLKKMSPFHTSSNESSELFQARAPSEDFSRHTVTAVHHDRSGHETRLDITSQTGDIKRTCILKGFWLDTHVAVGDIVNVLAVFEDGVCHITDREGLLIVNPDLLISGTTVVSSVFCMRKSILKEKFKGCDSGNVHMLYGSIIHGVFQQVLRKKLYTEESILLEAEKIVKQSSNLLEMYSNRVTEDKVMEEVKSYLPQILSWTKQYTNIGQNVLGNQRSSVSDLTITKVKDIEENIWSPRFGVKGKIDLTVEVKFKNDKKKALIPLELKTGKPSYSVEHKGQVTLYSMMSSDRREDPNRGLLLYLKEPSMKVIPADHVNKKGLIQLRNEMAYYITRQVVTTSDDSGATYTLGRLPEPITNIRACQKCPQLINCAIYQRQIENRPSNGSGVSALVDETLQHLTTSHITYYVQWCLMIDLESQLDQSKKTLSDMWCKSSVERENVGMCLSGMNLSTDHTDVGEDTIIISFSRHKDNVRRTSLTDIGFNTQDSIVVSCENPPWIAICTGFIHKISSSHIHLLTDRDVLGRMQEMRDRVFRLDKFDSFSTAGMLYTNLSRLMMAEAKFEKLRKLIIEKVKPEFSNTLSKGNLEKVKSIFKHLNKPQKTAILKVLMCKDYVLIKGYPGTGKTSTIVSLVKILNTLGLSVLLTSYTHSAVDNILLKLKKDKVKFLRLGRLAKIHPEIQEFSADKMMRNITSTKDLEYFLQTQTIVATSCLGTNHPMFSQRQFDVCIVDEASQVLQPACLGPLYTAQRFVLVGDPKQLPPVVQSEEARGLGMDESLFASLDSQGATFELNLQYRMNKEIMCISNQLVYKGCLQCGTDTVANKTLQVPHADKVREITDSTPWLTDVISTSLDKSVVFLDTQKIPAPEIREKGGVVKNYTEANIVMKIVTTFIQAGISGTDIGIIAPYRSQVFLLRNQLAEGQGQTDVEVNTVDQYQGRDKEVIIMSFVRSSQHKDTKVGILLKDVRRLNVALTRAKTKLVLVGNVSTLQLYEPLQQVIKLCTNKQQIITLPCGAI